MNEIDSGVQRVEVQEEEKIVFYFDTLSRDINCMEVEVKQLMVVEDSKPALITVYDYYNTEESASTFYNLVGL